MKKIILTFIILITINSCNIEKRLYRPGYNVDWKPSKIGASMSNNEGPLTDLIISENKAKKSSILDKKQIRFDSTMENQIIIENLSGPSVGTTENNYKKDFRKIDNVKYRLKTTKAKNLKHLKIIADKKISKTETNSGDGNGALKGIGWFFIILGIILVIFVSILIGILLMLLGLLFFVVGKSN